MLASVKGRGQSVKFPLELGDSGLLSLPLYGLGEDTLPCCLETALTRSAGVRLIGVAANLEVATCLTGSISFPRYGSTTDR